LKIQLEGKELEQIDWNAPLHQEGSLMTEVTQLIELGQLERLQVGHTIVKES
jgi:hypothetical protein